MTSDQNKEQAGEITRDIYSKMGNTGIAKIGKYTATRTLHRSFHSGYEELTVYNGEDKLVYTAIIDLVWDKIDVRRCEG